MQATLSPTLELPFDAVELPLNAALVPYEAPWVDLSAREVEEDEFPAVVAIVAIVAVVAVVAIVTGTHMESQCHMGPFGWSLEIN